MANLPESGGFVAGIYQLETTDPVEAGSGGIANRQAQQLAARTKWLKDQLDAIAWKTGDIKEVACTELYITNNFDGTGLGTNERVGWAICNGQNGTIDKGGRVGVGRGGGYTMEQSGGNKDAIVVAHTHALDQGIMKRKVGSAEVLDYGNDVPITTLGQDGIAGTASTGASGTDKNMQPYVVTLFIQKI